MAEMPELALGKDQREFGVPRPFGAGIGHRWLTEPLQGFGIELDAAGRSRKTPHLARPLAGIAADRVLDREGQALRRRPHLRTGNAAGSQPIVVGAGTMAVDEDAATTEPLGAV